MTLRELSEKYIDNMHYELKQIGVSPFTNEEEKEYNYTGTRFMWWDENTNKHLDNIVITGIITSTENSISKLVVNADKQGLLENYYVQSYIHNEERKERAFILVEKEDNTIKVGVDFPLNKERSTIKVLDFNKFINGEYDYDFPTTQIKFDHKRTFMGSRLIYD